MKRLIASSSILAASVFFFLRWSVGQTERQIDKMQKDAFNSPGADSAIPPRVIVSALGLVTGHFIVSNQILRLKTLHSIGTLIIGIGTGLALFFSFRSSQQSD